MKVSRELRHILGRKGEDTAVRYLEDQGCIILNRNWRTKAGELDIVALDGKYLVFVEVKTRSFRSDLDTYRSVSLRQIRRNRKAAQLYMRMIDDPPPVGRFDLIEIVVSRRGRTVKLSHHIDYQKPLYRQRTYEDEPVLKPVKERFFSPGIIFPCPLCGEPHSGRANSFCSDCLRKYRLTVNEIRCPDCGEELKAPGEHCKSCSDSGVSRSWDSALYLMDYSGKRREFVRLFKYGGNVHLARPFAELAADLIRKYRLDFDAVCAVPMPLLRLFSRSYNQAELVAERVAANLKLKRIKPFATVWSSRPQSTMNIRERATNRRNRYRVKEKFPLNGMRLLLIDDVYTTGATLEAASRALKSAGASSVTVLTCARTPRFRKR